MNLLPENFSEVHYAEAWWIISDIHGCYEELMVLLRAIPVGARVAYVGDYVDRGPAPHQVLREVNYRITNGDDLGVLGNHDWKAYRGAILGRNIQVSHGLDYTFKVTPKEAFAFLGNLPRQLHLAIPGDSRICTVVHAGIPWNLRGMDTKFARQHCLYGETEGFREDGFPNRTYKWRESWNGKQSDSLCVFGHDRFNNVTYLNESHNVVGIDTGCAFGGKLTAYNPFTQEVLEVPAARDYTQDER